MDRFDRKDVEIVRKVPLLEGDFVSVVRHDLQYPLFDGGMSPEVSRICCYRVPAVVVIPYDPISKKVVFVEQFRIGAMDHENPWMIELVAGLVEKGEKPEEVALRELEEETGLVAQGLYEINSLWASPGYSNEQFCLYSAKVDSTQVKSFAGVKSEGEDIKVHVMGIQEVYKKLEEGFFNSAPAVLGLQWLAINEHRLADLWS